MQMYPRWRSDTKHLIAMLDEVILMLDVLVALTAQSPVIQVIFWIKAVLDLVSVTRYIISFTKKRKVTRVVKKQEGENEVSK